MELTPEMIEQLKADLKTAKTYQDLMGENGAIKKIINDNGEIELTVPRDRNGSFDPVVVKKYERTLEPIEDKIISMYAKGMTTRDIQSHVQEFYGLDVSATLVSQITDKIIDLAKQWHNRPLEPVYPIVFFDAIHYKVTSEGKVTNKAVYTCLALNVTGRKDLLGLWVSEAEGANFWFSVMTELKNRGVQDILIACVDGLKGFPEAINTVFPGTEIQLCIIHLIRNTLRYIASKDQKSFMKELRLVYTAPTEEAALIAFDRLKENWGKKYPLSIRTWRQNWLTLLRFSSILMKLEKSFTQPMQLKLCIASSESLQNREAFSLMTMH